MFLFWTQVAIACLRSRSLGFGGSDKPAIDYSIELWEALLADFYAELMLTSITPISGLLKMSKALPKNR